jgi:hypothetical protein
VEEQTVQQHAGIPGQWAPVIYGRW